MAIHAEAVEILVRKSRFEPEVALGVAEAIEVSINLAQLVTVPVLDARVHELKTEIQALRLEFKAELADGLGKLSTEIQKVNGNLSAETEKVNGNLSTEIRKVNGYLSAEIQKVNGNLNAEIQKVNGNLNAEIQKVNGNLSAEIQKVNGNLSAEIQKVNANLSTEIQKVNANLMRWVLLTMLGSTALQHGRQVAYEHALKLSLHAPSRRLPRRPVSFDAQAGSQHFARRVGRLRISWGSLEQEHPYARMFSSALALHTRICQFFAGRC